MKFLFLLLSLLVSILTLPGSFANDGISFEEISELESQGKSLILGELTGVGKAIPIEQVDSFVTEKETIQMNKIIKIEFTSGSSTTVNNITKLVLKDKIIPREELKGLILK